MKILSQLVKISFLITLQTNLTWGQNIKIVEPEFSGVIVYANDTIGEGIRLEDQAATTRTKSNAAAYLPYANLVAGKTKVKNIVNGCCSNVIIKKHTDIQFIVKVKDNSIDPTTLINIFKLTPEEDKRTCELSSATIIGGTKTGEINYIKFKAVKYGTSSYLLTIKELEPGEYTMTLPERREFFHLFAIK